MTQGFAGSVTFPMVEYFLAVTRNERLLPSLERIAIGSYPESAHFS